MNDLSSDPEAAQGVVQAEREWLEAHLRLDVAALARLMGDEYKQINSRGELLGKQQVLASFQSGSRSWQQADSDEYEIRTYGEVAVVFGRWRATGINAGEAFSYTARYASVWVYRNSRWEIVSDQSTEMPNDRVGNNALYVVG